jgi:UDP-glucose:(heptosyl)LPS alpha-1,3-glucosyltransferase
MAMSVVLWSGAKLEEMAKDKLSIGFVRRGYSASGGAEAYLKRLAAKLVELGHEPRLLTTADWPKTEWQFGDVVYLRGKSPVSFADDLQRRGRQIDVDVLISLERVRTCDVFRAGDGVHRAWLNRREKFVTPVQKFFRRFNRKHGKILELEKSLFAGRGAGRVIVNSQMVKNEIVQLYGYPAAKIDLVRNGLPLDQFQFDADVRTKARDWLELKETEIAVLFAGSSWERKGLPFAIDAVESCRDRRLRLFVAGRGNARPYQSSRARFLGEIEDVRRAYAAADIFILPTIYDPFSNACLEALACGLPVITTRANGFSEIIEQGVHGSVVECPDDVPALREALVYWSDDARRSSARGPILERAAQFDVAKNVEETLAILTQIADSAAST